MFQVLSTKTPHSKWKPLVFSAKDGTISLQICFLPQVWTRWRTNTSSSSLLGIQSYRCHRRERMLRDWRAEKRCLGSQMQGQAGSREHVGHKGGAVSRKSLPTPRVSLLLPRSAEAPTRRAAVISRQCLAWAGQ